MKITNKYNLPEPFYRAVVNDDYDPGESDITVTQLKSPPRQIALQKQYRDQLEEDCSDRVWALLGQSVHSILERAACEDAITEERFYIDVLGWKVGGQIDYYDHTTLYDFKVTSAYVVKGHLSGEKNDWDCQLNSLAELMRQNGHAVKRLAVIAIGRDWSKMQAQKDAAWARQNNVLPNYPQSQIQVVERAMWVDNIALDWIKDRVNRHQLAQRGGILLPKCSDEDMWKKPDVWAVTKGNNKRAIKLHNDEISAVNHAAKLASEQHTENLYWVQHRPGTPTRCLSYCNAAPFCEQHQATLRKEAS